MGFTAFQEQGTPPSSKVERPSEAIISIVVPVFNEKDNIQRFLRGLKEILHEPHEVVIVYDFPEDDTLPVAEAMQASYPAIRLVQNKLGQGVLRALQTGFQESRGDVIVVMMADCSDEPGDVAKMASRIRQGADVVAASRYMPGGRQEGGPFLKRTLSRCAGISLHYIAGLVVRDATNNFRAYSRRAIEQTILESEAGFAVALELTVKAHARGWKLAEIPTLWRDRSAGKSRFNLKKWLPIYLQWYFWSLDRSPRFDVIATLLIFFLAVALNLGHLWLRPDLGFDASYVFGESGNQLFRADRLTQGYVLYRDVAMQYGPISAYVYAGFTLISGNTIAANHYYHLVWGVVCVVLLFRLVRRYVPIFSALIGTILMAFPTMLVPAGLIGNHTNVEYMSLQRICLVLLMLVWRPPSRSSTRDLTIGFILGLWQGVKFGGAFFAGAALVLVDLIYLVVGRSELGAWRSWGEGLFLIAAAFLATQAIWTIPELLLLPPALAFDTIWPAYVVQSYDYSAIMDFFRWNGLGYFLTRQVFILLSLGLAIHGLTRVIRKASEQDNRGAKWSHALASLALSLGLFFFLLGNFGYFGHVHLLLGQSWAIMPMAILGFALLRLRLKVVCGLILSMAMIMVAKITFRNNADSALTRFSLPDGQVIFVDASSRRQLEAVAELVRCTSSPGERSFVAASMAWGGGGFHHFYNPGYDLRNPFVTANAFRPYDIQELAEKLDRVTALIVLRGGPYGMEQDILQRACGPDLSKRLLMLFQPDPMLSCDGYILLVRRPAL